MVEGRQKTGISIGSNLIILIFGIVTLTTFAVLSYVSANADSKLAKKGEEAVTSYYIADGKGEELLYDVNTRLEAIAKSFDGKEQFFNRVAEEYPNYFHVEEQVLYMEEIIDEHLRINIRLKVLESPENGKYYRIVSWNIESYDEYVIDGSMPVWTEEELE